MAHNLEAQKGITIESLWHNHFGATRPEASAQLSRGTVNEVENTYTPRKPVSYNHNAWYTENKAPMITYDLKSETKDFIAFTEMALSPHVAAAADGDATTSIDSFADHQAATAKPAPTVEHIPVVTSVPFTLGHGTGKTSVTNSDATDNKSIEEMQLGTVAIKLPKRDSVTNGAI